MFNHSHYGSIICLDVGKYRVGLAGCDYLGITITALPPLHRSNTIQDLTFIINLIEKRNVAALVVGLPLNHLNQITIQSIHSRRYGKKLAQKLNLPIAWVNEHSSTYTTRQEYNLLKNKSGQLDSMVAYILLKQWLEERNQFQ